MTAPSARKLHSSALKSRLIIHEQQNLKGAIKVFSNNKKKKQQLQPQLYMEALDLFLVFSHDKRHRLNQKDYMGQMLGCIIEDFCHCPASSCLGHQQTHPRVREDSSCSFHTTPSCRQHGKGRRELQPATSKQPASLRTWLRWPKTRESPKTSVLPFFLNCSILYKSR